MKSLVTGGTGSLGQALREAIRVAGHEVRIMSRRPQSHPTPPDIEWAQADLASGEGLRAALEHVDAVIHAASDPRRPQAVDVLGTRRLVEAARAANISHLVYISIVGIDDIPYSYYRRKLEAEVIIKSSGVPYTILRATQFHSLLNFLLSAASRVPVLMPLPIDFKFQSVDQSEVAERLAQCLTDGPVGRATDFGGPEVLSLGEMATTWMEVKGLSKRIVRLPLPGRIAAAFRAGMNTTPEGAHGAISWREWLTLHTRTNT